MTGCRQCDYNPCMCGRRDYPDYPKDKEGRICDEDAPSYYCRVCDCHPCACGRNDYASEKEYRERVERENKERNNDPMGPFLLDMDDY